MNKIYIQLWSLKEETGKDFFGTLDKVAQMGYDGVEFAGYGDIPAGQMKQKLDSLGLEAISSHVSFENLQNNLDEEIAYLKSLHAKYIVCPHSDMNTAASAKELAPVFEEIGKKCSREGLVFAYHNHSNEFENDHGQYPLDVFLENVDTQTVKIQPDLYWIAYAGLDPIEYLANHIELSPIVHLKQIRDMDSKQNVDAGSGIIDFAQVMRLAPDAVFVYEQESFIGSPLENAEKSIKFLKGV